MSDVLYLILLCRRGFNKWRSAQLPVGLLADWAEMSGFEQPRWNGATEVVAGGQLHRLVDFGEDMHRMHNVNDRHLLTYGFPADSTIPTMCMM